MGRRRAKRAASRRREARGAPVTTTLQDPADWFADALMQRIEPGDRITARTALGLSAFWACVRAIAEDTAMLPLKVFEMVGSRGKRPIPEHPLYFTLHTRPNPEMSAMDLRQAWVLHALMFGNGYIEVAWDKTRRNAELWLLDPTSTVPKRDANGTLYYEVAGKGHPEPLAAENVLHLRGLSYDGISGYQIAKLGKYSLGQAYGAMRFSGAFFERGTVAAGALSHPGELSEAAFEKLQKDFEQRHAGATNAWKPLILEEGMTWTQFSVTPEQSQLLETLQFGVEEVARWFRVPLPVIGHLLRSTYSNVDALQTQYSIVLTPWLTRIEQELEYKLLAPEERGRLAIKHNIHALLRGDLKTQAELDRVLWGIASKSVNEIREDREMEGIGPAGDVYWMPSTMIPIEMAVREPGGKPVASEEQPIATDGGVA